MKMSTTTPEATAIEQMKREIGELNTQRATLQADYEGCNRKISENLAKQRGKVVAARVHKDKEAQAEVDKLSEEIRVLQDASLQSYAAIEELSATVKDKEAALDRAERGLRYGEAIALIKPRIDGKLEAKLLKLIQELRETAKEIEESDSEIATALHKLSGLPGANRGRLLSEAQEFAYRHRRRVNTICDGLKDVLGTAVIAGGVGFGAPGQVGQAFEKLVGMLSSEGNLDGQAA